MSFYEDNFDNVYDNEIYDNEIKHEKRNSLHMLKTAISIRQNNEKRLLEERKQREIKEKEKMETLTFKSLVSPLLNWVNTTQPQKIIPLSFEKDDSWISVKRKEKDSSKKSETNVYHKTKFCTLIKEGKNCPKGDKCNYAHFKNELIISNCPYDDCKFVRLYNNKYQNTHKHYLCDRRHKNETDTNFFIRTKITEPVTEKEMQDAYDEFEYHYSILTTEMKKYLNELPCDKVVVFHGFMFNGNAMASYKQNKIHQKLKEKEKIMVTKVWANFMDTIKPKVKEPVEKVKETEPEPIVEKENGWIEVKPKQQKKIDVVEKKTEKKLRTQICRSVLQNERCPYNENCSYAHTKRELNISECGFGIDCKMIKIVSGNFMNINKKKSCCYIHPSESKSNFYSRNNLN
jgi:hypothetical protein